MSNSKFHIDFTLQGKSFSNTVALLSFTKEHSSPVLHEFLEEWFSDSEYVIVKTSGSTGKPKPISLKKTHMRNSAKATGEFFKTKETTTALCCLPLEYIAGKMMVIRALTLGWHLDIIRPSMHPLESIEKTYDFSAMVPLQLQNSLEKIHLIKELIVGGGVVSYELEQQLQKINTKVYATYGMTETITHIAVKPLNSTEEENVCYRTLPKVSLRTDDRNCLIIHAPEVSSEEVHTNDIVELISENEFEWKGRYDNVINSGGIKLHPEEIERKLSPYISSRFFVIGIPDAQLGEKLILVVEGDSDPGISEKVQSIGELTKYERPKEVFFVSQFIETETKKVQRAKTLKSIHSK